MAGAAQTAPLRAEAVIRRVRDITEVVGVEVGVFRGNMSCVLLKAHPGLHLYMVDNWLAEEEQPVPYRETGDYHSKLTANHQRSFEKAARAVTAMYAERRTVMVMSSEQAAQKFGLGVGTLHFVFLDADHSYEGTLAAITNWWRTLRVGGWLGGHDYIGWAMTGPQRETKVEWDVGLAVQVAASRLQRSVELDEDGTWFIQK